MSQFESEEGYQNYNSGLVQIGLERQLAREQMEVRILHPEPVYGIQALR